MKSILNTKKQTCNARTLSHLLLISSSTLLAPPPQNALHTLSKNILRKQCSNVPDKQHELLALLKEQPSAELADSRVCNRLVDALEKNDTFPVLANTENKKLIDESLHALSTVPGFYPVIHHLMLTINSPDNAKGDLFLLKRAVDIHKNYSPVCALRYAFSEAAQKKTRRIIDIVTEHVWIKCKNLNWKSYPVHAKQLDRVTDLKAQLLDLRKLVKQHNEKMGFHDSYKKNTLYRTESEAQITQKQDTLFSDDENSYSELGTEQKPRVLFVVSSKQKIPYGWRKWLEKHDISYFDHTEEC